MTGIDSPEIALTWKPLSDVPFGEQRVLGAGTYIKPLSESLKNYLPTELLSLEQVRYIFVSLVFLIFLIF